MEVPPAKFVGTAVDVPVVVQINQVTKRVEFPQTYYIDKSVDAPVVVQRQVPQFQTVLKTGKVPQVQLMSVCTYRSLTCQCLKKSTRASSRRVEIPLPVAMQRQVPQLQTVAKTGFPVDQPGDQQDCRFACGDAANGPSYSDFVEDCESPAGVVCRQSCGGACVHADAPVVSAPVPQILEEPIVPQFQVETAEEAQLFPQERISELTVEVDDVHPVSATVAGKRKKKKKEEGRRRRSHRCLP